MAKQDEEKKTFPRMVYRKGTGKTIDEASGRYEAQGVVVHDEDQLKSMGKDWVDSPEAAVKGNKEDLAGAKTITVKAEHAAFEVKKP